MKGGSFKIKKIKTSEKGKPDIIEYEFVTIDENSNGVNDRGILETEIILLVFKKNLTDIISTIYSSNIPKNKDYIEKFLHNFVLGVVTLRDNTSIVDMINALTPSERNKVLKKYRSIVELRTLHLNDMSTRNRKSYLNHKKKLEQFKDFLNILEKNTLKATATVFKPKNNTLKATATVFKPKNTSLKATAVEFKPKNTSLKATAVEFKPETRAAEQKDNNPNLMIVSTDRPYRSNTTIKITSKSRSKSRSKSKSKSKSKQQSKSKQTLKK